MSDSCGDFPNWVNWGGKPHPELGQHHRGLGPGQCQEDRTSWAGHAGVHSPSALDWEGTAATTTGCNLELGAGTNPLSPKQNIYPLSEYLSQHLSGGAKQPRSKHIVPLRTESERPAHPQTRNFGGYFERILLGSEMGRGNPASWVSFSGNSISRWQFTNIMYMTQDSPMIHKI